MYDLSVKEKIPVSQLGQITSTDLANGVLVSQGYTAFVNPGSTIAAGAGATALQNFVNAGGIYIGSVAGGTTSARNAGITLLNTSSHQRAQHAGLDVRRRLLDGDPGRLGLRHRRLDLPLGERRPDVQPGDDGRQRDDDPGPTAVVTYGPSGDCGGPVFDISTTRVATATATATRSTRTTRCRRRTRASRFPGRPAVVDQPFGAGHAILIGFDPWYRMWTMQEERLVLNGVLYPAGSAIPAS